MSRVGWGFDGPQSRHLAKVLPAAWHPSHVATTEGAQWLTPSEAFVQIVGAAVGVAVEMQ